MLIERLKSMPLFDRDVALREQIEANIAKILLLDENDYVDPNDGFFELGLTSLSLTDFALTLRADLQIDIDVGDLFNYSSIDTLVTYLKENQLAEYFNGLFVESHSRCVTQ